MSDYHYYGRSDDTVYPDDSAVATCPECEVEMDLLVDGGQDNDDLFKCPHCGVELYGEQVADAWDRAMQAAQDDAGEFLSAGPCQHPNCLNTAVVEGDYRYCADHFEMHEQDYLAPPGTPDDELPF